MSSASASGEGGSKDRENFEFSTPSRKGRETTPSDDKKSAEKLKKEDNTSNSSGTPSVFTFQDDHIHKAVVSISSARESPLKYSDSESNKQASSKGSGGSACPPHPTLSSSWSNGRDKGLRVNLAAAHLNNMSTPITSEGQWSTPSVAPHSPGALSWHGEAPASIDKSNDVLDQRTSRISRKESYKAQRQHYRREKQKVASALLSSLGDPSTLILADWLKVRGSLKSWTKLWCVLKPGLLLLYKSPKTKSNHWVGTVLLSTCHVMERPSKKEGFCFKLYHPLEQGIWAPRGPHNEAMGAVVQPLPSSHLIFRAPSKAAGHCWLDGLELAQRCSNTLLRNSRGMDSTTNHETQWSPEDMESHFTQQELSESDSDAGGGGPREENAGNTPLTGEEHGNGEDQDQAGGVLAILNNVYTNEGNDEIVQKGEVVEELAEENKSLLWFLLKQVRPGMDLSRVALPTFILEPRSFLDKLSDSFYHADILSRAVKEDDPFTRMKIIVTWYLSGLYKKPKGLKKPYNPVLGELFRCCWLHENGTRTYYIAEQVSHHPPVSAFYVSNRKEGYTVQATILARSKFYGNSTSAILEGRAAVRLLGLNEVYLCTSPYAHCGGLLLGTLSMELGGRVSIHCPSTNYTADIDFKLKPFIGGSDSINMVSGRIRHNKETLATVEGHWDGKIDIKDKKTQEESILLDVSELKHKRMKRQLVAESRLGELESQRLWSKVTEAINNDDQSAATEEKIKIEEAQRTRAGEAAGRVWQPRHFSRELLYSEGEQQTYNFIYNHNNPIPWDDSSEVLEYEEDFVIKSLRQQPATHQVQIEHSASETDSVGSRGVGVGVGRVRGMEGAVTADPAVAAALLRVEQALGDHKNTLREVINAVHRLEERERKIGSEIQSTQVYTRSTLSALIMGCVLHWLYTWWRGYENT